MAAWKEDSYQTGPVLMMELVSDEMAIPNQSLSIVKRRRVL